MISSRYLKFKSVRKTIISAFLWDKTGQITEEFEITL